MEVKQGMPASLEHLFKKTSGDLSSRYLYCHPDSPDGKADYPRIVNVECLREKANVDIRYHATSNPDGIDMRDMAVSVLYHYNVETLEAFLDTKSPPIKYNHHGIFSRVFIEREGNMLRCGFFQFPGPANNSSPKVEYCYSIQAGGKWTLLQAKHWGEVVEEKTSIESGGMMAYYCIQREKWAEKKNRSEKIVVENVKEL